MQGDSPGAPFVRALVHPQCKDVPHPDGNITPSRPVRAPFSQQPPATSLNGPSLEFTVSAAVFATTGTATATVAQALADPTVNLTGTAFTARTYGRVGANGTNPLDRITTYTSTTAIAFELETADIKAGAISVGAVKRDAGVLTNPVNRTLTVT